MARTRHHSEKHGTPAMGDGDKNRAAGYEFWTPRAGKPHGVPPGRKTKKATHKRERRLKREEEESE